MIQVQATFSGFGGKPCSLFSAYDEDARILVVGAEAAYRAERRPGCLVVTNDPNLERDRWFENDHLMAAIQAFFALKAGVAADGASARLLFAERAVRADPNAVIERDGYDSHGPRYRISDGVTCAQMAALATCLYAVKAETVERVVDFSETLMQLLRGGSVVTI